MKILRVRSSTLNGVPNRPLEVTVARSMQGGHLTSFELPMSLEPVLQSQFNRATSAALSCLRSSRRVRRKMIVWSSALIYLAGALLFYVGAILVANGTYTYLQLVLVQILNLVVFTVTIYSQLMALSSFSVPSFLHFLDFLVNLLLNA